MNSGRLDGLLTRGRFIRGAAGTGVALALGGTGEGIDRLMSLAGAATAASMPTVHRFHTHPELQPQVVTTVRHPGSLAEGLLFMTPSTKKGQQGTLITDNSGEPIWFRRSTPAAATDLRVASYRGQPVLTWWEGTNAGGLGRGTHVVADTSYRVIARLPSGNGLPSDLHEFLVTPKGTALVTAWETVTRDLRGYQGPASGKVVGGVVQELELPSGKVLFEWHSLDHVSLDESHSAFQKQYDYFDYFHVNSIAPTEDGNLLVSARNTWGIYKVDRGSGEVIWRLGGKKSDFRMGPGTLFAWQHDARPHGGGLVSLFDDGAAPKVQSESRGLLLALDEARMRATLVRAYPHSPPVLAFALGNTQLLANGNVLVGYGTVPSITEFAADGTPRLELSLPADAQNYRTLRFPWSGRPLDPPRIARDSTQLYVSWNGATDVASWQLKTGATADALTAASTYRRSGFETALPMPSGVKFAAAVALDGGGKPLGATATLSV